MADTGAPFELPFPLPSDFVRVAPADFQALAEQVEEYLLVKESRVVDANVTLQLADTSRVLTVDSTTARTVTVPTNASVAFPIGAVVNVYNAGSGTATVVAAGGVTVRNAGGILQFTEVSLRKRGTDEWVLAGAVT
jgi:hypothetical protein